MADRVRTQVYNLLNGGGFKSNPPIGVQEKLTRITGDQSYIVPVTVDVQNEFEFSSIVKNLKEYLYLQFYGIRGDDSLEITETYKDNNNTVDLVFPERGNERKCTVRVYRLYAYELDNLTETNAGISYQTQLINKMRSAGYTTQQRAEEGESGADLTLNVNGIEVRIEIKSPGSAYGSGQLQYRSFASGWTIKPSDKQNPEFEKILAQNNILPRLSSSWYRTGYFPEERASKYAQQQLGERRYEINSSYIRQYYNKVHYLQYKNKGLFLINVDDNPLKLDIPLLDSNNCYFRARVQNSGRGRFKYVGELYAPNLITYANQVSLDGDLDFLENINN